jgi:galactonate dehydratase
VLGHELTKCEKTEKKKGLTGETMRVTDIKTQIVNLDFRNTVIVKVETDEGINGMSETTMKRKTLSIEQSILELKRYLVGMDPTEIENHWEKMYRDSFWVGGTMHSTAISAIDCALWDILAKSCRLPVHKLLGGPTRTRVPVYCHCPAGSSPEEFAENMKLCKKHGYLAAKTTLPLFYGAQNSDAKAGTNGYSGTAGVIDRTYRETEYLDASIWARIGEFFIAAREAVGPTMGIAVDCHGRLNLKNAVRLCRALEKTDLMFVEEPVPPENADVYVEVRRGTSIPIAAGERWATIYGVREFVEKQAVDILQCDLVNCGGITGMKKIAALAEAHYIGMAPHNPNGPLATAMNVHFAATIPNYVILETIGANPELRSEKAVVKHPLKLERGCLLVPAEPGYGIQLAEEAFSQFPFVPHGGWR